MNTPNTVATRTTAIKGIGRLQLTLLIGFWLVVAVVLFTTLAPLTNSAQWWVRGWDFPRVHIALIALIFAIFGVVFFRTETLIASTILLACAAYQSVRIFPYTTLASVEIEYSTDIPDDQQITAIASNVLMENTDHAALVDTLERGDADVVFLMETDQAWVEGIDAHLQTYDTVIRHPMDNHYGLVFATNLEVISAKVVRLTDDNTPSVLAELVGPTGPFFFVGLHPRPPVPGNTTEERDAQIRRAALIADSERYPVVAMGDFNDAAWSYTSQRFKEFGDFLDPRVGRGMLPSFDATSWYMRFPIDQLYMTRGINLVSFDRMAPIGSDHFPMIAKFSVATEGKSQ